MIRSFTSLFIFVVCYSMSAVSQQVWLTSLDKSSLLEPRQVMKPASAGIRIITNKDSAFQTMDGFGFALTGGSAQHIIRMSPAKRSSLLQELFGKGPHDIGISYLRLSIGASDLNEKVFSYDDLPPGETDLQLKKFSLSLDTIDVIPVLKEILRINPSISIMASPWSAPLWMKTNNNIQAGKLKKEYYPVYANYFVRYITEMRKHNIRVEAITIQNEPFNDGNTPSMQMFAKEQAAFIKDHLGPAFAKNHITTKIILYDHNCDAPEYPISILTDKAANKYIDGSGFHLYVGPITAMTTVHNAFPDKSLYFTEMMAVNRKEFNVAGPVDRIMIGATRNWSRNVILWNLAANSANQPHTDNGGCSMCQGAVSIDGDSVTRNLAYYTMAHFSKFVPAGSKRIASNETSGITNVAFLTPDNKLVLIAANKTETPLTFTVDASFNYTLPGGSVATFKW